ncbi:MAG: hypothetical protein II236_06945 [Alistipes sp.]|nr:hypothetical protein [Alistipes sp.]
MMRDSMIVYQSWLDAVKELPEGLQGEFALAIMQYGLEGQITCKIGQTTKAMLALVKPMIDANNKRYENGKKGAEFGVLGGRPKKPQENPEKTPEKPQENPYNELCNMNYVICEEDNTPTPAREEKLPEGTHIPTSELYDRMANDEAWLMKVSANTQTPIDTLRKELDEWCKGVMMTEDTKELTDARRHFIAWRRKRPTTSARPTDGGRPYHLRTYEQMLAECAKLGCTTEAYVAVRVRGKIKPSWVTKTEKETYQIPDEL